MSRAGWGGGGEAHSAVYFWGAVWAARAPTFLGVWGLGPLWGLGRLGAWDAFGGKTCVEPCADAEAPEGDPPQRTCGAGSGSCQSFVAPAAPSLHTPGEALDAWGSIQSLVSLTQLLPLQ